ncbi:MAG: hypothetical protein P8Z00_07020 [Anaerolineales bacterium]|jgi:hypothetical protein
MKKQLLWMFLSFNIISMAVFPLSIINNGFHRTNNSSIASNHSLQEQPLFTANTTSTPTVAPPPQKKEPTPTRRPRPTSTPIPIPPPANPTTTSLMILVVLIAVIIVIVGVWLNRPDS